MLSVRIVDVILPGLPRLSPVRSLVCKPIRTDDEPRPVALEMNTQKRLVRAVINELLGCLQRRALPALQMGALCSGPGNRHAADLLQPQSGRPDSIELRCPGRTAILRVQYDTKMTRCPAL